MVYRLVALPVPGPRPHGVLPVVVTSAVIAVAAVALAWSTRLRRRAAGVPVAA